MTNPHDAMLQRVAVNAANAPLKKKLAEERSLISKNLATMPSFIRGMYVGAFLSGGLNVLFPEHFWGIDLPNWARVTIGVAFLVGALNYLLRQRGWMVAKRVSRA